MATFDNFANAGVAYGPIGQLTFDNTNNTTEGGENTNFANHSNGFVYTGSHTAWIKWVATYTGEFGFFATTVEGYSTYAYGMYNVYQGTTLGGLTLIEFDSNGSNQGIQFPCVQGQTYYFQIGSYQNVTSTAWTVYWREDNWKEAPASAIGETGQYTSPGTYRRSETHPIAFPATGSYYPTYVQFYALANGQLSINDIGTTRAGDGNAYTYLMRVNGDGTYTQLIEVFSGGGLDNTLNYQVVKDETYLYIHYSKPITTVINWGQPVRGSTGWILGRIQVGGADSCLAEFRGEVQGTGGFPFTQSLVGLNAQVGDRLLVGVDNDRNVNIPTPSGWTRLGRASRNYVDLAVFTKVATGSDSITVTDPTNQNGTVLVMAVAYEPSVIISAATGVTSGSDFPLPQPLVVPDARVVHFICGQEGVVGVGIMPTSPDAMIRRNLNTLRPHTESLTVYDWVPPDGYTKEPLQTATDVHDNYAGVSVSIWADRCSPATQATVLRGIAQVFQTAGVRTIAATNAQSSSEPPMQAGDRVFVSWYSGTGVTSAAGNGLKLISDITLQGQTPGSQPVTRMQVFSKIATGDEIFTFTLNEGAGAWLQSVRNAGTGLFVSPVVNESGQSLDTTFTFPELFSYPDYHLLWFGGSNAQGIGQRGFSSIDGSNVSRGNPTVSVYNGDIGGVCIDGGDQSAGTATPMTATFYSSNVGVACGITVAVSRKPV